MLTHIVCWKYKPETGDAERVEHRAKLTALTTEIGLSEVIETAPLILAGQVRGRIVVKIG